MKLNRLQLTDQNKNYIIWYFTLWYITLYLISGIQMETWQLGKVFKNWCRILAHHLSSRKSVCETTEQRINIAVNRGNSNLYLSLLGVNTDAIRASTTMCCVLPKILIYSGPALLPSGVATQNPESRPSWVGDGSNSHLMGKQSGEVVRTIHVGPSWLGLESQLDH